MSNPRRRRPSPPPKEATIPYVCRLWFTLCLNTSWTSRVAAHIDTPQVNYPRNTPALLYAKSFWYMLSRWPQQGRVTSVVDKGGCLINVCGGCQRVHFLKAWTSQCKERRRRTLVLVGWRRTWKMSKENPKKGWKCCGKGEVKHLGHADKTACRCTTKIWDSNNALARSCCCYKSPNFVVESNLREFNKYASNDSSLSLSLSLFLSHWMGEQNSEIVLELCVK